MVKNYKYMYTFDISQQCVFTILLPPYRAGNCVPPYQEFSEKNWLDIHVGEVMEHLLDINLMYIFRFDFFLFALLYHVVRYKSAN